MPRYRIRVNVIELGRTLIIDAASKREARDKARNGDWPEEGSGDPEGYKTHVVGKVEEISEGKE